MRRETRERADNADNDGSSDAIRVEKKVGVWGGDDDETRKGE